MENWVQAVKRGKVDGGQEKTPERVNSIIVEVRSSRPHVKVPIRFVVPSHIIGRKSNASIQINGKSYEENKSRKMKLIR